MTGRPSIKKQPIQGNSWSFLPNREIIPYLKSEFAIYLQSINMGEDQPAWITLLEESIEVIIQNLSNEHPGSSITTQWLTQGNTFTLKFTIANSPHLPEFCSTAIQEIQCSNFYDKALHQLTLENSKNYPGKSFQNADEQVLKATIEELSLCYEVLSAFYKLGPLLIKENGVDHFVNEMTQKLSSLISNDGIFLTYGDHLESVILNQLKAAKSTISLKPQSIEEKVLISGEEYIWENRSEVEFSSTHRESQSGICAPLKLNNQVLGTLSFSRNQRHYLKALELNTIRTFADLISISIAQSNNEIIQQNTQKALQELELASEIQQILLPVPNPITTPQHQLYANRRSALEVSGDYVDAITTPQGELLLIAVDVMGKGISAAFVAAMLKTTIHLTLSQQHPFEQLMAAVNKAFCQELNAHNSFATCSFALICPHNKSVSIANAGHCAPLIIRNETINQEINPSGPPLGIFADAEYEITTFPLETNDLLLMVTDGLFEWTINDQCWGWDKFLPFISRKSTLEPQAIWNALQDHVTSLSTQPNLEDDQTLIAYKLLS